MKFWKNVLVFALSALLCWTPSVAPFVAYAASAQQEENSIARSNSDDAATVGQQNVSSKEASSQAGDSTAGTNQQPESLESQGVVTANSSQVSANSSKGDADSDNAPATASADDVASLGSTGFAGNSFRFSNGEPLSTNAESDGGLSLFSLKRPDGVTGWGIDVSQFQGSIDWAKVKAAGVDFVIIRAGYGHGGVDNKFIDNVRGAISNGVPFGVYLYSYAYDVPSAQREADWVLNRLSAAGVTPDELSFPVYYDLENEHKNFRVPAGVDDSNQYRIINNPVATLAEMAKAFTSRVQAAGYTPGIYANLNWWNHYLTSSVFNNWTRWVAQYNSSDDYTGAHSMWQYSSKGQIDGIAGNVDLNYLYDKNFVRVDGYDVVNIKDGSYYINAQKRDASSISSSGSSISLQAGTGSANQQFVFSRQSDGSYVISQSGSGIVLGVSGGKASNGAAIKLEKATNASSQRWFIRDSGSGYVIQSALGNWVLDLKNGSIDKGAVIQLYQPNLSDAQKFMLASVSTLSLTNTQVNIVTASKSSLALHVSGDSRDDFALLEIDGKRTKDSYLFKLVPAGSGIYEIVNMASGKAVEAKYGDTANGSAVGQYSRNGSLAQHWAVVDNGNNTYTFINMKSGKALDVTNGQLQAGTKLQLFTANGTAAQAWKLVKGTSETEAEKSFAAQHKNDLPDGTYSFSSAKRSGSVLDARNGGTTNGTAIQLYQSNGTDAQMWRVTHDGDYVVLTNAKSGLVADVPAGKATSGTELQLYQSNGTKAQRWIAVKGSDGSYELLSAVDSTKALEIQWGNTNNGTSIWLYDRNQTASQHWSIMKAQPSRDYLNELAAVHKNDMPDGTYVLFSKKDSSKAFAVSSGNAQLATFNAKDDQRWIVTHDKAGYITLTSASNGKVLDAKNGSIDNCTRLQSFASNGTWAQKWIAIRGASGEITLLSGNARNVAVDCQNGQTAAGTPLQLFTSNGTVAQQWIAQNVSTVSNGLKELAAANRNAIKDGTYAFVGGSSSSHMVLDVAGGSTSDGGNIQVFTSNATPAQRWKVSHDADGFVTLTSAKSGKVLEVAGGWAQAGRNVQQWASNGTAAQKWIFISNSDGSYRILTGLWESLSLDIANGAIQNYSNVQLYMSNNTSAQRWYAI